MCTLAIFLPLSQATAIPESEAIKKLQVIPVFVITDSKGVPLPIPNGKTLVLPLYLERSTADQQLDALRKNNSSIDATVVAVPLDVMNRKVAELNGQLKDKQNTLVAPIVGNDQDRRQAELILREEGMTARQISDGLNVPVFFTKPFLTINTPNGPRGVFFFHYDSMLEALAKLAPSERQELKPQVADLTAVLREIIKEPRDAFVIFPTPEYFKLANNNHLNKGSWGAAYGAAVAPGRPARIPEK